VRIRDHRRLHSERSIGRPANPLAFTQPEPQPKPQSEPESKPLAVAEPAADTGGGSLLGRPSRQLHGFAYSPRGIADHAGVAHIANR